MKMTSRQQLFSVCCLLAMGGIVTGIPVHTGDQKDAIGENLSTALSPTVTTIKPVSIEMALLKDGEDKDTIDDTEFNPITLGQDINTDANIGDGEFKPVVIDELGRISPKSKGNASGKKLKVVPSAKDQNESIVLGDQSKDDSLKVSDLEALDSDVTEQTARNEPTTEPIVSEEDGDSERSEGTDSVTRENGEESTIVSDVDDDNHQEDEGEDDVVVDEDLEKGTKSKGDGDGAKKKAITTIPHIVNNDIEEKNGTVTSIPANKGNDSNSELAASISDKTNNVVNGEATASLPAPIGDDVESDMTTSVPANNENDIKSDAATSITANKENGVNNDMATSIPANNEDDVTNVETTAIPSHDDDNANGDATTPLVAEDNNVGSSDAGTLDPANNDNNVENTTTSIPAVDGASATQSPRNENEEESSDQDDEDTTNTEDHGSEDTASADEPSDEDEEKGENPTTLLPDAHLPPAAESD